MKPFYKNIILNLEYDDEYLIDIVILPDGGYEAWLYERDGGVKTLMFGGNEGTVTDFIEIVEANVEEHIFMRHVIDAAEELYFGDKTRMYWAIVKLYKALDLDVEFALNDVRLDDLSVFSLASDGNEYLWYWDGSDKEGAIQLVDGAEVITDQDTLRKLFEE